MTAKTVKEITESLSEIGFDVSALNEEYSEGFGKDCDIPFKYGHKTGAILLRITPKEAEAEI